MPMFTLSATKYFKKYFTKGNYYCKRIVEKENVGLIQKLSALYTTETVDSLIHICRRGNHHDRIDVNVLDAGVADVDEDHVALYLEYYD